MLYLYGGSMISFWVINSFDLKKCIIALISSCKWPHGPFFFLNAARVLSSSVLAVTFLCAVTEGGVQKPLVNQLILLKLKEVTSREPTYPTWWKGKASSKVLGKRICWFPSVSLAYFLEKDRLFQNLKKSLASKPVAIGHFASKVTESSFSLLKVIQIYAQHGPSNIA